MSREAAPVSQGARGPTAPGDSQGDPVIVLVGPTAVGKSALALRLAVELKTEIVSADSRQVYRRLDLGTSKPSPAHQALIVHHMIDVVEPDEPFNAGRYAELARVAIGGIRSRGLTPLVVGGTGLYVKALFKGLWPAPPPDWTIRQRLEADERRQGTGTLYGRLREVDSEAARTIHSRDLPKIIRALEVYEQTGRPLSVAHRLHGFRGPSPSLGLGRPVLIGLTRERPDLYRRIDQRVEAMIAAGLVEEVRGLLVSGCNPSSNAMRALGYHQIVEALEGRCTMAEAIRRLTRDTKRYAKRQWTWFKSDPAIRWIPLDPHEEAADAIGRVRDLLRVEGVHIPGTSQAVF